MRIEIIHSRCPDASCDIGIFIDGVPVARSEVEIHTIDPGAGWEPEDWEQLGNTDGMSPAAAELFSSLWGSAGEAYPGYVGGGA